MKEQEMVTVKLEDLVLLLENRTITWDLIFSVIEKHNQPILLTGWSFRVPAKSSKL